MGYADIGPYGATDIRGFGTLWEGGIRVPLLIRWPGEFDEGRVIDRPTIAMDLTATMLAAAGRDTAALELDGKSVHGLGAVARERAVSGAWRRAPGQSLAGGR